MASKDYVPDDDPAEEGVGPLEVDQSPEGAGPSTAGASVSKNLFDQLLASIRKEDTPRSNFIFDQLARMSPTL